MLSRTTILHNIRRVLRRSELDSKTIQSLETRLTTPSVHEQPFVEADLVKRFIYQLEKVAGTQEIVASLDDVPVAVQRFLQKQELPPKVVASAQLQTLSWPADFTIAYRAAQAQDVTSIGFAFAGVAETGSIVFLSSADNPTTLNFLPDTQIVILKQKTLVAHIEDVWVQIRQNGTLPRTINFVTGPSRTADIEQTIQLGAHGPRHLHVIIVTS